MNGTCGVDHYHHQLNEKNSTDRQKFLTVKVDICIDV